MNITAIDHSVYAVFNGLAGRSLLFDTLVGLAIGSNLVKAALIGACFVFAWHQRGDEKIVIRRRTILLVTLAASIFVIATTKTLSKTVFLPRPFILSEKTFLLEGGQLVETPRLVHRVPLDDAGGEAATELKLGQVRQNDLGSFPSDHAGFFMTLAAGIFMASRRAGIVALLWTLFPILGSRIVTGMHSPLDIAAGAAIGLAILAAFQFVARRWGAGITNPVAAWTLKHQALSSAFVFLCMYEAANTLENVRHVASVLLTLLGVLA